MPWLREEDALSASVTGSWEASGETARFFPSRPGGTVLSGALPDPASITPQQAAAVHGGLAPFLSVKGPARVVFAVLLENALKRDSRQCDGFGASAPFFTTAAPPLPPVSLSRAIRE